MLAARCRPWGVVLVRDILSETILYARSLLCLQAPRCALAHDLLNPGGSTNHMATLPFSKNP